MTVAVQPLTQQPQQDEPAPAGAPRWMVTYGDTVTLLVTFFVLMLTFSTPDKENLSKLRLGILPASSSVTMLEGGSTPPNLAQQERMLATSRLSEKGAATPPAYDDASLDELKKYHPSVQIAEAEQLKGWSVIRVPVAEMFSPEAQLSASGREVLDQVVKVARGGRYRLLVRVFAAEAAQPPLDKRAASGLSARMALEAASYLERGAGRACEEIGVSQDVELLGPPLRPGEVAIVMLEV